MRGGVPASDTRPGTGATQPVITGITVTAIDSTSVRVSWSVTPNADGAVDYGTTTAYSGGTARQATSGPNPSVTITGLTASTLYHYRVRSTASGLTTQSGDFTFTTPAGTSYAAVFSGDATGATDVSSAFASFVNAHPNQTIALAVNGVYRFDGGGSSGTVPTNCHITASGWTLDFRGSRIVSNIVNTYTMWLHGCSNVTLNDPRMTGRGYGYVDTLPGHGPSNNEHLIAVDGGANVTINRPVLDHSYGDAIYGTGGATTVVINQPDLSYCGRNAISPVSADFRINGGTIHHCAQYGVDWEPNNSAQKPYCKGWVDGTDFRVIGDPNAPGYSILKNAGYNPGILIAAATEYAVVSGPFTVNNITADLFWAYFYGQTNLTMTGNKTDAASLPALGRTAWCQEKSCTGTTYSGNDSRITRLQW